MHDDWMHTQNVELVEPELISELTSRVEVLSKNLEDQDEHIKRNRKMAEKCTSNAKSYAQFVHEAVPIIEGMYNDIKWLKTMTIVLTVAVAVSLVYVLVQVP